MDLWRWNLTLLFPTHSLETVTWNYTDIGLNLVKLVKFDLDKGKVT